MSGAERCARVPRDILVGTEETAGRPKPLVRTSFWRLSSSPFFWSIASGCSYQQHCADIEASDHTYDRDCLSSLCFRTRATTPYKLQQSVHFTATRSINEAHPRLFLCDFSKAAATFAASDPISSAGYTWRDISVYRTMSRHEGAAAFVRPLCYPVVSGDQALEADDKGKRQKRQRPSRPIDTAASLHLDLFHFHHDDIDGQEIRLPGWPRQDATGRLCKPHSNARGR